MNGDAHDHPLAPVEGSNQGGHDAIQLVYDELVGHCEELERIADSAESSWEALHAIYEAIVGVRRAVHALMYAVLIVATGYFLLLL